MRKNYIGIGCLRLHFCTNCGAVTEQSREIIYIEYSGSSAVYFCSFQCADEYYGPREDGR